MSQDDRELYAGLFNKNPEMTYAPKGLQTDIVLNAIGQNPDRFLDPTKYLKDQQTAVDHLNLPAPQGPIQLKSPEEAAAPGLKFTGLQNPYAAFNPAAREATYSKYAGGLSGPALTDVRQAAKNDSLEAGAQNFERGVGFDVTERARKDTNERFNKNFQLEQKTQDAKQQQQGNEQTAALWKTFFQTLPYLAAAYKGMSGGGN